MNAIFKLSDLMPALMIVYDDETFSLDIFHSDIRTTMWYSKYDTYNKYVQGKKTIKWSLINKI